MDRKKLHWKERHKSIYYAGSVVPDCNLVMEKTALLIVDLQNAYLSPTLLDGDFYDRLKNRVIPTAKKLLNFFRARSLPVFYARIACLTLDGRDRSLSQKRPGFNDIILYHASVESQIVEELSPLPGEVVVTKTTDSALTGTNLALILRNMAIEHVVVCGIFTDQCISSTVRSLADESFNVVLIEDGCTAATEQLHDHELTVINNIYCQVMYFDEFELVLAERHS
ncbi:isochorismatase family cysteine hydrolase [Acidithiobacillus sp. AMEEHan]|uniref:cysteine hydrolase family protein n=1 Tax=Acidithiobacillus sp. AMEEHan TaxID=2994951 RepID=UPI0027E472EE|nr:isochorismatase family cysteine hydrolase [Acidithiobacillus sp. AMEEHan]